MTNYIILALCVLVVLSYIFDITSKYSKIPGVILLIGLGIGIQVLVDTIGFRMPNMKPILPVIGTLGLILIVLEASLDISIEKNKIRLITRSISSAIILFAIFVAILSLVMVKYFNYSLIDSIINAVPLGIISSAVAISSSNSLGPDHQEFIVYESSFSDIVGILVFDFIVLHQTSIGIGIINFAFSGIITVIIAIAITSFLAILLHKISYHINYVIIMTAVVMAYVLAKLSHLPALFLVLVFGLSLSNNRLVEHTVVKRFVDFEKFRSDLASFKKIVGELTFIVRSFFFIMFGYYAKIDGLLDFRNIMTALIITTGIFLLRWIYFKLVMRMPIIPLGFFAPRGLITILLFISIPEASKLNLISEEVTTLIILMTIVIMMGGNMLYKHDANALQSHAVKVSGENDAKP